MLGRLLGTSTMSIGDALGVAKGEVLGASLGISSTTVGLATTGD